MDIDKVGNLDVHARLGGEPVAPRAAGAVPNRGDGDVYGVSEAAESLRAELSAPDPARAEQIARLKQLVAEGRYQPDNEETARRFLGR
jgi:anti-sigma28 factor (negative regulator of flagellin synthesis)